MVLGVGLVQGVVVVLPAFLLEALDARDAYHILGFAIRELVHKVCSGV